MRLLVLLAAAALVPSAGAGPGASEPALALLSRGITSELVRVDPATLRILGPRVALGRHDQPWGRSPDRSLLVIASGRVPSLVVVDVRRMRALRSIPLDRSVIALAWPEPRRILVVLSGGGPLTAVVLDPSGRALSRRVLGRGSLVAATRTTNGLALVLSPRTGLGPARVAVVDARGSARSVSLRGITAGWKATPSGALPITRFGTPGLAADGGGRRLFVVAHDTVAEIGLDRLSVTYHPIRRRAPEAAADGGLSSGVFRRAVWAGAGLLAVTGWDDAVVGKGDKRTQKRTPAGLRLLDTPTWSEHTLDGDRTAVIVAGRLLLASGSRGPTGNGLAVYDRTGRRRLHAFGSLWLGYVPTAGRYAYAGLTDTYRRHRAQVLDLWSGRVVARPWVPALVTLLSDGVPHVCWC